MESELKGCTALIVGLKMSRMSNYANPALIQTGASMGIGEAIALALAEKGMNVALLSRSKVRLLTILQ